MDLNTTLATSTCSDIWVRYGVHKPTSNSTSRPARFVIERTLNRYGGFIGNEFSPNERNLYASPSAILPGAIDDNDNGGSNRVDTDASQIVGANGYHVAYVDGGINTINTIDTNTLIEGLIITACIP